MEDFLGVPWWEDSLSFLYVENLSASSAGISGSLAFPPSSWLLYLSWEPGCLEGENGWLHKEVPGSCWL